MLLLYWFGSFGSIHFLIFDEFLIKPSIRQVPISKLSAFFSEEGLTVDAL